MFFFCSSYTCPASCMLPQNCSRKYKERSILQARAATICTSWKNPIPDNYSETTKAVTHGGRKSTICEPFLHVCLEKTKKHVCVFNFHNEIYGCHGSLISMSKLSRRAASSGYTLNELKGRQAGKLIRIYSF